MRWLAAVFALCAVAACGSVAKAPAPSSRPECGDLIGALESATSPASATALRFVITNASPEVCLLPAVPRAVQVVDKTGRVTSLQFGADRSSSPLRLGPYEGAALGLIYTNLAECSGRVVFVEVVLTYHHPVNISASGAVCPPYTVLISGPFALEA